MRETGNRSPHNEPPDLEISRPQTPNASTTNLSAVKSHQPQARRKDALSPPNEAISDTKEQQQSILTQTNRGFDRFIQTHGQLLALRYPAEGRENDNCCRQETDESGAISTSTAIKTCSQRVIASSCFPERTFQRNIKNLRRLRSSKPPCHLP